MKRLTIAVAAALAATWFTSSAALAGRPFEGWFSRPATDRVHVPRYPSQPPVYGSRYDPYRAYQQLYPKYYGGFHYRDLYYYGTPTGDMPLRGTPW